ncbi:hypothetical protein Celal_0718 [Cellulophaga algicola DSM 14237]|uniref:Uncharacterized protein n=1 Tax=Cellulophaga algicola (strain DSM 14237 / IC166 / ACAM 630) TaxID=688270 RepID=E6XDY7_CELAD|nr:hypothetical protein [Cellulophaga algicola]ADV48053.1 hypothetical protein Celal_0718 [Cellulophaga algicola DSM 14237]
MKILHAINTWSFTITVLLYITIFGGLMAQFILGIIQVIMALYLTYQMNKNGKIHTAIRTYWSYVIPYLILLFVFSNINIYPHELLVWIYLGVIPMVLAGYFVHITKTLKNEMLLLNNSTNEETIEKI